MNNEICWPTATLENRPWTRWWWMGSAVDRPNLTRSLQELQDAGFGGVELTPIYGIPGYEDRFIRYLSPEWMEIYAFTCREAASRGLGLDMPTGTGWPFGGAGVSPEESDAKLEVVEGKLTAKPSGFKVKRPAPGGEGPALNPYSPEAMTHYLERFTKAFAESGVPMPRSNFHDSFEYHANWSQNLPQEFKQLCGYEIESQAEALQGHGDPETVARVRADYRRTLADLHLRYIQVWNDWAHRHGSQTREQAHGAPGNLLDLYAAADIPETETFGSNPFPIPGLRRDLKLVRGDIPNPLVAQFASSAAHTQGKRLVACESCTWLREHFNTSLAQVKPELDQMFVAGINHVIYHGTCYSPDDAKWPGWLFYASVQFNPRNSIWRDLPELNRYITRIQSILQSGTPDNDILLYWPFEDLLHQPGEELRRQFPVSLVNHRDWLTKSPCGDISAFLSRRGYRYDYLSDRQSAALKVVAGQLVAPGGAYKTILIPRCDHMPLETLERLLALAEEGATILIHQTLPADVPGLAELSERRSQLAGLLGKLVFAERDGLRQAAYGRGHIVLADELEALLTSAGVTREPLTDHGLKFIRRNHDEGKHYFIVNLGAEAFDGWTALDNDCRSAIIMDPLSGVTGLASLRECDGATQLRLQLKPGQSLILRTFETKRIAGNAYPVLQPDGKGQVLTGTWEVSFIEGGPELPPSVTTDHLTSWTDFGGTAAERFGGTARYRLEFDWQPEAPATDWLLDLGEVRESARVSLNGQTVGAVWSIPFEIRVGEFLKSGNNILEIEVTNLCANRVRDMDIKGIPWKKFGDINMATVFYSPLDASIWPVLESGLLGPLTLIPMKNEL